MSCFDNDENSLINFIKEKGKEEWIDQWTVTRNKSLKKDELIIHYSDLSHLRSLISWCKSLLLDQIPASLKYEAKEHIKKIIAYLENYITKERNETFHSRLQLYDIDELNEILVDTKRLLKEINHFKMILT